MHPGEHSGHVIDLGLESSTASTSPGSMPVNSDPDDASEQALIEPKTTKMRSTSEYEYPLYQQVCFPEVDGVFFTQHLSLAIGIDQYETERHR